jgi:Protein of unknown function (DUF2924)
MKAETEADAASSDAESSSVDAEISRLQTLKPDDVKKLWRETFKQEVPKALTRDLLVRILCWRIQERALGGHGPAILKLLASYTKGKPAESDRLRRLKPGTELIREYQGERHTVVISAEGFRWQGENYRSLTAIARAITGTNWNGPRFFGLRESPEGSVNEASRCATARPEAGRRRLAAHG